MSFVSFIFPITTIALAVACFACYRNSKPLREKAKEEAKEAAEKKAQEEAYGREKARRENQRKEFFSDLEQALATPERELGDNRYGSSTRGGARWKHLFALADMLRNHQRQSERVVNQTEQIAALRNQVRDLRNEVAEVHRKLEPYA